MYLILIYIVEIMKYYFIFYLNIINTVAENEERLLFIIAYYLYLNWLKMDINLLTSISYCLVQLINHYSKNKFVKGMIDYWKWIFTNTLSLIHGM